MWPGYTAMLNVHYLGDRGGTHYDENGFLTRPAPVGRLSKKVIDAFWLGWNGDGHIGPVNVTHSFYQVLGEESRNPINAKSQHISAQMATEYPDRTQSWSARVQPLHDALLGWTRQRLRTFEAAVAIVLLIGSAMAAENLKSGPQAGDKIPGPFHPMNITGAFAGQKQCLV